MSSTHTTHHVYDKSRPGIYPKRSIQQQQTITFNETFRTLFPAVLAVLLSLIVLSAFNHMDSSMLTWIQQKGINGVKDHKITGTEYGPESIIPVSNKNQIMNKPNKYPWTEYEALGSKTSPNYWQSKEYSSKYDNALQYCKNEQESLNKATNLEYEALGSKCSASYWENKYRLEKYLETCIASHLH